MQTAYYLTSLCVGKTGYGASETMRKHEVQAKRALQQQSAASAMISIDPEYVPSYRSDDPGRYETICGVLA